MKSHTHEDDSGEFECPIGPGCRYQEPLHAGSRVCFSAADGRTIIGTLLRRSPSGPGYWLIKLDNGHTCQRPQPLFMR